NCQNCCVRPEIRGACGVPHGEHHDATNPTCDLRFGYGRNRSLRLHLHSETDQKATNFATSSAGLTSARLFRPRKKKGALIGRAAGEAYRSLMKLNQVCDPRAVSPGDESRRIAANIASCRSCWASKTSVVAPSRVNPAQRDNR